MRKRVSTSKPERVGEILQNIFKKKNIPHLAADRRLIDLWRQAVGPEIAVRTHPETLKRGSLYVRVSASVWMHQLQFLKEEILQKINSLPDGREIRGLFFSIGEIPTPPPEAVRATHSVPVAELGSRDREMLRRSLKAIGDPELREILKRVMTREISTRRAQENRKGP